MRTSSSTRSALKAAMFFFVFVAVPAYAQQAAQGRLSAGVVAQLVADSDVPEARARLAEHFSAVAADYDDQAREHKAMATTYRRIPTGSESKRPSAPDTAVHCDRLADRAADAAAEARALAATYGGGAVPAQVPSSATRAAELATSNPADLLEATDLRKLAEGVQTPEAHARLERHYLALAAKLSRDAREHRDLAASHRAAPTAAESKRPGAPDTAAHCERLAERVSKMADEARALATSHGQKQGAR